MIEHRKRTINVLQKYIDGEITPKELFPNFPDEYGDDELLDYVFNIFSEPLEDITGMHSWEEIAQVCIRALEENWSLDFFDHVFEEGLPSGN